jgi:UDP:flavonoid glycosyltransferase YjiC (YdhE family)
MSVVFVTWNGGGNVNPVLGASAALAVGGSMVQVLGDAAQAARFEDVGARFVARDPALAWDLPTMAEDVRRVCAGAPTDLVVVDYMLVGALCGAEATGIATVAFVHTLYGRLLVDGTPTPMFMAATVDSVNELRAALGLAPVTRLGDLLEAAESVLITCPEELDLVTEPRPANVRYVRPVLEPGGEEGWTPPAGDGPLIVVSLGTTPMGEEAVLTHVLDAVGPLPARVLVTVGDHLDPSTFSPAANTTVAPYLRHATVLPHTSLMISHAGLGSVLASLTFGVPLLCLPLGREQPDNAQAVVRVGAGLALPPDSTSDEIRASVQAMLDTSSYTDGARTMASLIAGSENMLDALEAAAIPN